MKRFSTNNTSENTKIVVIRFHSANRVNRAQFFIGGILVAAFCTFMGAPAMQQRPFRCEGTSVSER